ncbi:MAG: hypothetical protein IT176_09865 [Acidobacteria bacterium]|nr:hypothetical protein [Acidobacteriota bacterium]
MKQSGPTTAGFAGIALTALLAAGCAHAEAARATGGPPLEMPVPPPREIVVLEVEVPPPPPPAEELPRPAPPPRPKPAPRVEAPKPEPPEREAPPPGDSMKSGAATTLQTAPPSAEGELERSIRDAIGRASANLARIDYRRLNADARSQYDTAKRFIQQADDAVRARNLVFAKNLADKAATLADQLGGR